MSWQPLTELAQDLRSGKCTATELTKRALDQLKASQEYNAIISTNGDAMERAAEVDKGIASGI